MLAAVLLVCLAFRSARPAPGPQAVLRVWPPDYDWTRAGRGQRLDENFLNDDTEALLVPWMMSMTSWTVFGKKTREEVIGGGLREVFGWSQMSFRYPSQAAREVAEASGRYKPENCLPLGLEVWGGRLFVSFPRWRPGVPATLASVALDAPMHSPPLDPYPSLGWHTMDNCNSLISVFRMSVDECGRLWVLDSGKIDIASSVKPVCPAQIFVFDLGTDRFLFRYQFPKSQTPAGNLLTNIAVDVRHGDCDNAYAYISDVFRYGLIVYSLREDRSWRVDHPYFYPDPLASRYSVDGIKFSWTDGVFGLALSPVDEITGGRVLFFHPLSSHREFSVATSQLRNETIAKGDPSFRKVGEPRKKSRGQAAGSAMDRNGILFYNLMHRSSVGCWNSKLRVHTPQTQGVIAKDNVTLSFPNDLKVDQEPDQSVWVLSNRLHRYLYSKLDPEEINYRVLTSKVRDAVRGTPCEPGYQLPSKRRLKKKCQEL